MSVLADGCFDPVHVGHIAYLKAAAKYGSPLYVNIADDDVILAKGRKPFQARIDRGTTVLALGMVDAVRFQPLPEAIRELHPTYLVKGKDWQGQLPDDVLMACYETGTVIVFTATADFPRSTERLKACH